MDREQKKDGLPLTAKTISYCSSQYVKPKYSNLRLKHYWSSEIYIDIKMFGLSVKYLDAQLMQLIVSIWSDM